MNHKLEPLSYVLQGGDQVEVLSSQSQTPQLEWIGWVTTAKAQGHLTRKFRREGLLPREPIKKMKKKEYSKWNPLRYLPKSKHIIITDDTIGREHVLAPCCSPIPGDDVLGYLDDSGTFIIHKRDCHEADILKAQHGKSLYSAEWKTDGKHSFPAVVRIEGIDKVGMIIEILKVVSERFKLNMCDINFKSKDGIFIGNMTFYSHNTNELNAVCQVISTIEDVKSVQRIENETTNKKIEK